MPAFDLLQRARRVAALDYFRPDGLALRRLGREAGEIDERILQPGLPSGSRLKAELARGRSALRRSGSLRSAAGRAAHLNAAVLLARACETELGRKPSHLQIMAALAMHEGRAVELDGSEDRGLSIAFAAILAVWSGHPCHIVASSDHVARRDAALLSPLFVMSGCAVATLAQDVSPDEAAPFYGVDILYATGRRLLSDFMRGHFVFGGGGGNLRRRVRELRSPDGERAVMKGAYVAIIDDVGASLIDDATAPLVISLPGKNSVLGDVTLAARAIVDEFQPERDYLLQHDPNPVIRFTREGYGRLASRCSELPAFWRHERRCEDVIAIALLARDVLQRDRHYAVQEQRIAIMDDGIQRLLSGYAWHFGVIQAIEAREGLPLTIPPRTVSRTVFQEFFPRYHRLAGSGSVLGELRRELRRTYELRLLSPPSRFLDKPQILRRCFRERREKMNALIAITTQFHHEELPALIATRRIADTIEVVTRLGESGLACNVLEGRDPESDAEKLASAMSAGSITIVTGAVGRGFRITAGDEIPAAGGLQVLMFEHHESKRADRAFIEWTGCRGAPGKIYVLESLEDELVAQYRSVWARPLRFLAKWPATRRGCLAALIHLSQRNARLNAARHRKILLQREEQLDQQLSFFSKLYQDSISRF